METRDKSIISIRLLVCVTGVNGYWKLLYIVLSDDLLASRPLRVLLPFKLAFLDLKVLSFYKSSALFLMYFETEWSYFSVDACPWILAWPSWLLATPLLRIYLRISHHSYSNSTHFYRVRTPLDTLLLLGLCESFREFLKNSMTDDCRFQTLWVLFNFVYLQTKTWYWRSWKSLLSYPDCLFSKPIYEVMVAVREDWYLLALLIKSRTRG